MSEEELITKAGEIYPRLSADARTILELIAALGGVTESHGVPQPIYDELIAAECIYVKEPGHNSTPLGRAVVLLIRMNREPQ